MKEPKRFFLEYDSKEIEYWAEWGEIAMWYYQVDGEVYELRPLEGPDESGHAELESLIKLLYLRGPGVANPGEKRPRYCLKDAKPPEPEGTFQQWLRPGQPYHGRPIEWTRTETGEVEIELTPPKDLEGARPVLVGSPYLVRLPPEE